MTHALLVALNAHWKSLFDSDPKTWAVMGENLQKIGEQMQIANAAEEQRIAAQLGMWEIKRAAFHLDATLGGKPKAPGPLHSSDWGTHWILFSWDPPEDAWPPWGYRIERSADNRGFIPVDVGTETEVTLLNQPQGQKFYYRVVAFNGFGDGPPSPVFGVKFDPELVDHRKKHSRPETEE